MSEDVYAKPDLTRKVRFQASGEDQNVEVEKDIDEVIIYDNYLPEGTSTSRENLTEERQPRTTAPVSRRCGQSAFRVAALLLLALLLLVSLAAVIVLATFWNLEGNNRAERERFSNQQKNFSDQLKVQTRLLDESTGTVFNLTQKMIQLEQDEEVLTAMTDNLTSEVDNLRNEIQEARRCQANWTQFGRSCYFISTSKKNWSESQETCERHQANLVIISSQLEQIFVNSLNIQTWIGLIHEGSSILTNWRWVDGTEPTRTYWGSGEPSAQDNGIEKCGQIKNFHDLKSWNNVVCNGELSYICEKIIKL